MHIIDFVSSVNCFTSGEAISLDPAASMIIHYHPNCPIFGRGQLRPYCIKLKRFVAHMFYYWGSPATKQPTIFGYRGGCWAKHSTCLLLLSHLWRSGRLPPHTATIISAILVQDVPLEAPNSLPTRRSSRTHALIPFLSERLTLRLSQCTKTAENEGARSGRFAARLRGHPPHMGVRFRQATKAQRPRPAGSD